MLINFYLNGEKKIFEGDNSFSLLSYLRDIEGITSPKDGCAPQAACGACTVIVDGKATLSCATPMKKVEDKNVTTIEGLSEYKQRVFANAFVEKSGVQCGFCIPGIVMSAIPPLPDQKLNLRSILTYADAQVTKKLLTLLNMLPKPLKIQQKFLYHLQTARSGNGIQNITQETWCLVNSIMSPMLKLTGCSMVL